MLSESGEVHLNLIVRDSKALSKVLSGTGLEKKRDLPCLLLVRVLYDLLSIVLRIRRLQTWKKLVTKRALPHAAVLSKPWAPLSLVHH